MWISILEIWKRTINSISKSLIQKIILVLEMKLALSILPNQAVPIFSSLKIRRILIIRFLQNYILDCPRNYKI